jgi:hypothetical protein
MHHWLTHAANGLKPISYREPLLSTHIHESHLRTSLNTLSAILVHWSANDPLLYVSHILIIQYFSSTYLFQRRTTVHLPKYHTHSCRTQQDWVLSHKEELHWARLYIYFSVPQATKGIVSMKYSDALLITIPHIVLVITIQKFQEPIGNSGALLSIRLRTGLTQIIKNRTIGYNLQRTFIEKTTTCKIHSYMKQLF